MSSGIDEVLADEQQETEVAEQEAGEETSATEETVEQAEAEPTEEAQTEEQDDDLADPEIQKYVKRYGVTKELLEANPSLKFLLRDKFNTDKNFSELQEKLKAKPEETKAEEKKPDPPANLTERLAKLSEEVKQYNDPAAIDHYAGRMEKAKDYKEMLGVLSEAMHNYMTTAMPKLAPQFIEANYPGFGQQWNTWSSDSAHDSAYAEMRKADSKLPEDWRPLVNAAIAEVPVLGQAMNPKDRLAAAIKLSRGGKDVVAQVEEAVAAGKKQSETQTTRKELGKVLGSGQSKGQLAPKKTGNDDIFGSPGEVSVSSKLIGK